jgi:hypothetical protein
MMGALTRTAAYGSSILSAGMGITGVFLGRRLVFHYLIADTQMVRVS